MFMFQMSFLFFAIFILVILALKYEGQNNFGRTTIMLEAKAQK